MKENSPFFQIEYEHTEEDSHFFKIIITIIFKKEKKTKQIKHIFNHQTKTNYMKLYIYK